MAPQQLPLDLEYRPALGMADFVIAPGNRDAIAWIDRWPDWPAHALAIHGPKGSGKTHLAHVWQARSNAAFLDRAPAAADTPVPAAIVLDAPQDWSEPALLHLYNHLAENRGHLLIVAKRPPARWNLKLRDLASRLAALPAVGIDPPDDQLIEAVLVKLFADRQLAVAPDVVTYLTKRVERSFETLRRLVGFLDRESLARHRPVTLPLAREIVARETLERESH